ncbi:MAG: hypothetical protein ACJ756_09200 [Solirubrobacterales bacterium]
MKTRAGVPRTIQGAAIDDKRNILLVWIDGGPSRPGTPAVAPLRTVVARARYGRTLGTPRLLRAGGGAKLVSNGSGEVVVTWTEPQTGCGQPFCNEDLWMAEGTITTGLRPPVRLTTAMVPVCQPVASIGARGDAVVAWCEAVGTTDSVLRAAYRTRGNTFGSPHDVGVHALSVDAGVDARGDVALAWFRQEGPTSAVEAAWARRDGEVGPAQTIESGEMHDGESGAITFGPVLGVAPDGTAMVGWSGRWPRGHVTGPTQVASGTPAAAFRPLQADLPSPLDDLVSGPHGGFAMLFSPERAENTRRSPTFDVVAAVADGKRFAPPQTLARRTLGRLDAAIDGDGDTFVAWWIRHNAARIAVRTRGGRFSHPAAVAGSGRVGALRFAANSRGDMLAAWSRGGFGREGIALRLHRRSR